MTLPNHVWRRYREGRNLSKSLQEKAEQAEKYLDDHRGRKLILTVRNRPYASIVSDGVGYEYEQISKPITEIRAARA
jgi:hypothetical protein